MSSTEILLIVLIVASISFSLYKKYYGKDKGKAGGGPGTSAKTLFSAHSKDDDYEPYSGK